MLRVMLGFLVVISGTGAIDSDHMLLGSTISCVGLALMYWPTADGTFAQNR